jgi:hypothetical protein
MTTPTAECVRKPTRTVLARCVHRCTGYARLPLPTAIRSDTRIVHAAAVQSCKYRRLCAPATNSIWTKRSPVSGDLLLSLAALSIPARSPFSVIFNSSPSGSRTMASINARIASTAPDGEDCREVEVVRDDDEVVHVRISPSGAVATPMVDQRTASNPWPASRSTQVGDRFMSTRSFTAGAAELRLPPPAGQRRTGPRRRPPLPSSDSRGEFHRGFALPR